MDNIYEYKGDDFDKSVIFDKIDRIHEMLEEERSKDEGERDKKREFELIYAKFIQGLKLSVPSNSYWKDF